MSPPHATASSSQMTTYGLIGAGGFGRSMIPVFADMLEYRHDERNRQLVFVVEGDIPAARVNGFPVIGLDEFLRSGGPRFFNVAISDSRVRERLSQTCLGAGIEPATVISRTALILNDVTIGIGAIFAPFSSVSPNATIGRFFQANFYAHVSHDCIIGDFVTFAPSVQCNGHVTIEDHVVVGSGAAIRQGTRANPMRIGKGAVIGMGAVVLRDVDPYTTVVGNPARPMER